MKVEIHGTPNYQRFAETWAAIIAAKEGMEVVPGSVRVERRNGGLPKMQAEGALHRLQTPDLGQPVAEVPMP